MKDFIFLEHTADIKFQAFGLSLEQAFENSARAMFAAMCKGDLIGKSKKRKIYASAKDYSGLLQQFLEELIFLMDTEDFFLKNVKVKIAEGKGNKQYHLEAEAESVKASEQEINIIVKAVTYNDMFVKKENNKYICQVVVDV